MTYNPLHHGARCDICPLAGHKAVPPEGDSAVVIIGDSPGKQEEQTGRVFTGATGQKLVELLRRAGMPPRAQLMLTNAVLCRPEIPDEYGKKRFDVKQYIAWIRKQNVQRKKLGAPPIANPFDCCRPRLRDELARAELLAQQAHRDDPTQFPNGAVIFPTGNFALAELMGVQKRAMKSTQLQRQRAPPTERNAMSRASDETETFDDVTARTETKLALLCVINDAPHWVPKSVISADSDVYQKGDVGALVVAAWWAEKEGLG